MRKRIMTISRQFGSGGRSIGREAANALGIAYYDRELIEKVAKKTGFSPEFIADRGEYSPSSNLFAYSFVDRSIGGLSMSDYLYNEQRRVILELAEKEPCVIVGRCADYILRDRQDCIHAFIHASEEARAERIVKLYGETDVAPRKRLMEKDKKRAINYKYYTDQEWGMAKNYDITLDSGTLGIDTCVQILVGLFK
jgi:cytidylate kinase